MKSRFARTMATFSTFSFMVLTGMVYALASSGCDDPASHEDVDARAPMPDANTDVCSCQGAGALAQRITHLRFDSSGGTVSGLGASCENSDPMTNQGKLLGGGGALSPLSPEDLAVLTQLGVPFQEIPLLGEQEVFWFASLGEAPFGAGHMMDIAIACLDATGEPAPELGRQFDISHALAYASIPTDSVADASARCERGVLVGGSCTTNEDSPDAHVVRAGMDPADENAWLCSWRSYGDPEAVEAVAQAFCLEESIAEECDCPPFTDTLTVRRETLPLGPGTNQVQASCIEGESLLLGHCMLEGADSASWSTVALQGSGFPPGDEDTWNCAWHNNDMATGTAIAAALCIAK
jgi:hypothetical protein